MIELLFKFVVLVVASVIGIWVWRSRTDDLLRLRQAKNYAWVGIVFVAASHLIDVVSILALLNSWISPDTRQVTNVVAAAFSAVGVVCVLVAVWRWLEAGEKLAGIANYEFQRSGELHSRLDERGLALSTVPAVIYRVSNLNSTPELMRIEFMNEKVEDILGYPRTELERSVQAFQDLMHPDDRVRYFESEFAASLQSERSVLEHRLRHRDGGYRWIRRHNRLISDADGNPREIVACGFDVTDLKDAEARLQSFFDFAPDAVVTVDENCEIVMASQVAAYSFGQSDGGLVGQQAKVMFDDESRHRGVQLITDEFGANMAGKDQGNHEVVCQRSDGTRFPAEIKLSAIDSGDHRLVAIAVRDISDRKETEAKLYQAQKMEAVGQLTGGIAHDFNNMLTVIGGNLQLIDVSQLSLDDRDHAQAASQAVERAAELTSRLLAFSCQQVLQPQVFNVNDLIEDVEGLLQRSIGEGISLHTRLDPNLWCTKVDRSQLENALVNLSINARDALQFEGRLEISTSNIVVDEDQVNVPRGEYVQVTVRDDGDGIDPGILSHIFEPFFTTKSAGKGSGLGLSMVYGFITQSQGHITVASEEGAGTTFVLYLPRSTDSTYSEDDSNGVHDVATQGHERILVVDDNDPVREIVSALLTSLNYEVIKASSGAEALEIMQLDEDFDLLFTDLVMPGGITGIELAARMRRSRPGLKVLYTSGQSAVQANNNRPQADVRILQKPYVKETLAEAIREALDS